MNLPFNADESRALDVVRACVASKVSRLPHDDAELVDSGALDSMAWVDTLISIESAMGIRDFGNPWPEDRSKTIHVLTDMVLESRSLAARKEPRVDIRPATSADGKISIPGWACSLGSRQLSAEQIDATSIFLPTRFARGQGSTGCALRRMMKMNWSWHKGLPKSRWRWLRFPLKKSISWL